MTDAFISRGISARTNLAEQTAKSESVDLPAKSNAILKSNSEQAEGEDSCEGDSRYLPLFLKLEL
jgi:hypothetical protein